MKSTDEYERLFREAGLGDEPDVRLDLDEPATVTHERLAVRVTAGSRELVVWPAVSDLRVAAYVNGEPAVVRGTASARRVGDRLALARHFADAEHGGGRPNGVWKAWLRLLELALAAIETAAPVVWGRGLPPASDAAVADYVTFPVTRNGLDSMFLGHRSRGKTTLVLANELSLLSGVEVVPGLSPIGSVDAVVHVNYENPTDLVHTSMRSIVGGTTIDPACLDRWLVIGQAGTPRLDRLAELVADAVAQEFPEATSIVLDVDSAEAAIASLGNDSNGDSWGARASALFSAYADLRRLLHPVTVTTMTTDHGDAKNPGLTDEVESFERMGAYGSRRKADLARAVHTLGHFGTFESNGSVVRVLMIGTAKPWPDRQVAEPIAVEAWHDMDTGRVGFRPGQRQHRKYPDGIRPGSRGAQMVDVMRQGRDEEDKTWWSTADLITALSEGGDTNAWLDDRVRETLRRHRQVFVSGSSGWRLSGGAG